VVFPVIVKPEREDGSLGIERDAVVYDMRSLRERVAELIETLQQPAVVQRYIHGREIGVSLLGWPVPRALPPGEIVFGGLPQDHPHILTFSSKWVPDSVGWNGCASVPAVLRPPELRRVAAIGRRAFEVLGLRDYGRVDVRLDERGDPYVIDVNPNCDLSDDGGFGLASARAGLGHGAYIWEILRGALRRRTDSAELFASRGRSPQSARLSMRARAARVRAPAAYEPAHAAPSEVG
jgi:D-alanine-D-alanine ligase